MELLVRRSLSLPLEASPPDAADLVASCLAWDGPISWSPSLLDGIADQLRLYGAAMFSMQAGDDAATLAFADSMAALEADSLLQPVVRNMIRGLRGEAALRSGDIEGARAQFDELEWEMAPVATDHSWYLGLPRWHLLRGEAAWQAGDVEEARRWFYDAPQETENYSLLELRKGQIQEALGNIEQARIHYARVAEVLESADPEAQPRREEALERLTALLEAEA